MSNVQETTVQTGLLAAADAAVRAVPPVWPLASSVAVNPYLGQTGDTLARTGARLARVAGCPITMPRSWYLERIAAGTITDDHLADALAKAPDHLRPQDVEALKAAAATPAPAPKALPTVAELAAQESGTDWPRLIAERVGHWAAGYFDAGQALWSAPRGRNAWTAWRATATHDLTPEIHGLAGFAQRVAEAPDSASEAIARAVDGLGLDAEALDTYFHQLLMTVNGWAQVARYHLWQAELAGTSDETAIDLLAIRLTYELALYEQHREALTEQWLVTRAEHSTPLEADAELWLDAILQEAAERAAQCDIAGKLNLGPVAADDGDRTRPALQAAFCIDVRSEVFRRALEGLDARIETLGFAGFFGIATSHKRFASDTAEHRLPVLLNAGVHSVSGTCDHEPKAFASRIKARATRAWGRFKLAAVSSFAFVEASGPLYIVKLIRDSLGGSAHDAAPTDPAPRLDPDLHLEQRIAAARTVLSAMSLTDNFARVVVLAGHGANVVNNPHASALHCGACGGYSGEVNARLLAGLLNDGDVRQGLRDGGLEIPEDTWFVGALHDTTTDAVTLYADDSPSTEHAEDLAQVRTWLRSAGQVTRGERALSLPRAESGDEVSARSGDWAETRPEWALAGCRAFIAAPRGRTAGHDLGGRAFLHNYDWQQDEGFGVLELILTAPVVVASWISLQYYGSSVSPEVFGGGNKLLHNVVGGIGVVEGNGGLLRAGLPWQSVHDGEGYQHEPLRLSVIAEAPREAISEILGRHDGVRDLFDNGWLHLFSIDGDRLWRYTGDLQWAEELEGSATGGAFDTSPPLSAAAS
ncbi:MAG: DUF2309 domain-containing protein [Pseudomonadota bacterium]